MLGVDLIGTDVLGDAAGLAQRDLGVADRIEQLLSEEGVTVDRVSAIDASSAMLDVARRKVADMGPRAEGDLLIARGRRLGGRRVLR